MADTATRLPPLAVSLGGIPFNKEHLDAKDAQIARLQARVSELTASLAAEREHIRKQAEDIMTLGRLVYDGSPSPVSWKARAEAAEAEIARLTAERDEARGIVRDIHWMARRYADGRQSYAPGMFNDAIRKAYEARWLDHQGPDPQYARDGTFDREYIDAVAELARLKQVAAEERIAIAKKAREWAGTFPQGSHSRNTFILLAEWIEARRARQEATDAR